MLGFIKPFIGSLLLHISMYFISCETICSFILPNHFFSYPLISFKLDDAKFNFVMCLSDSVLLRENLMFLHVNNKSACQPL